VNNNSKQISTLTRAFLGSVLIFIFILKTDNILNISSKMKKPAQNGRFSKKIIKKQKKGVDKLNQLEYNTKLIYNEIMGLYHLLIETHYHKKHKIAIPFLKIFKFGRKFQKV